MRRTPLQREPVGIGVDAWPDGKLSRFHGRQLQVDLRGYLGGHGCVQGKDIGQRAFIGLGPDDPAGPRVHQSQGNAHGVAGLEHGTVEEPVHTERSSRLRQRLAMRVGRVDSPPGHDLQPRELRQLQNQGIVHPVDEVGMVRVMDWFTSRMATATDRIGLTDTARTATSRPQSARSP